MRITADADVLVGAIVADEPSRRASLNQRLRKADLALLDQGGDFADGIIAFEGASLAGATFATFDKDTAKRFKKLGQDSLLLA